MMSGSALRKALVSAIKTVEATQHPSMHVNMRRVRPGLKINKLKYFFILLLTKHTKRTKKKKEKPKKKNSSVSIQTIFAGYLFLASATWLVIKETPDMI